MEVHDLFDAASRDRMPKFYGAGTRGTIPSQDIRPDTLDDLIGNRLLWLWMHSSWNSQKAFHRESLDGLCEVKGYVGLWVDPRDYLVHRVGQSFLYNVPAGKLGNLQNFAGQTIRVVCVRSGTHRVFARIGAVGNFNPPTITNELGKDDLGETPHIMARFPGVWPPGGMAGGYARAWNLSLHRQAAVWYARRYYEITGKWPRGTHEFIIKYGPTPDYNIRTPIGTQTGYRDLRITFEIHPKGKQFIEGNNDVGLNWYAMPIDDLLLALSEAI